jgi:hypothetical protein
LTKDSPIKSEAEQNGKVLAEPFTALRNNQADTLSSTRLPFHLIKREEIPHAFALASPRPDRAIPYRALVAGA